MPHKYSEDALRLRRARALRLGFLVSKPVGTALVCVPQSVAARAKVMATSLVVHDLHDRMSGHHSHFARNAAALAKPHVSDFEFVSANIMHQKANAAKHGGPVCAATGSNWSGDTRRNRAIAAREQPSLAAKNMTVASNISTIAAPVQPSMPYHAQLKKPFAPRELPLTKNTTVAPNLSIIAALVQPHLTDNVQLKEPIAAFVQPSAELLELQLVTGKLFTLLSDAKAVLSLLVAAVDQQPQQRPAQHSAVTTFLEKLIAKDNASRLTKLHAANASLFNKFEAHAASCAKEASDHSHSAAAAAALKLRMKALASCNAKLFFKHEFAVLNFEPLEAAVPTRTRFAKNVMATTGVPVVAPKRAHTKPCLEVAPIGVLLPPEPIITHNSFAALYDAVEQPSLPHYVQLMKPIDICDLPLTKNTTSTNLVTIAAAVQPPLTKHVQLKKPLALNVLTHAATVQPNLPANVQLMEPIASLELPLAEAMVVAPVAATTVAPALLLEPEAFVEVEPGELSSSDLCEDCGQPFGGDFFYHLRNELHHCAMCHASCSCECMLCWAATPREIGSLAD
jgi:hypothetical protein